MGANPANLVFRFLLEGISLVALAVWGWSVSHGTGRYLLAVIAPLAAALLWGLFAAPGDPTRSGQARVPIPGILRLGLELALFGFAVWGLGEAGQMFLAWIFGILILVHYLLSYDRILWLLRSGAPQSHRHHHGRHGKS